MPAISSYDYAIIRLVPDVERGECINVGVILFCRTRRFMEARIHLDEARVRAFAPTLDLEAVRTQLDHLLLVCSGNEGSGPIGQFSQSERFHWLVSPRSTIIQISPVHSGLCQQPENALSHLLKKLVL
ncbi:DUF3037 domain-containing protein [Dictyobacter aurantiacus]|uniref:DUF3037 domain-containing protein n=1 Tax=Dictyobacter aurantiacus TaxID=1936993 RepID=A0A401ZED7_9CHLR|nr:DUF3037 domain-containing protein [Dictyobacter aurantiacus]GCE05240.1 hypothetical protein KDAU_25690 [Dictyobacter aurantiacus]